MIASGHGRPLLHGLLRDPQGIEHTVEVSAQSLFEAVAQALHVFREYEWCDLALAASVLVRIRQPEVEHRVQLRDFYNWLDAAGQSPAEMALKNRLRDLISKSLERFEKATQSTLDR